MAYADSGADCNQFTNLGTDSRYCGLALSTNNMAMVGMDIPICGELSHIPRTSGATLGSLKSLPRLLPLVFQ